MIDLNPRNRILLLTAIMSVLVATTSIVAINILYRTALDEETTRLSETAKSQARLIEAVARFDKKFTADYPSGAMEATLAQIREAHSEYEGFGDTGEFTLAERKGNQIVFLLSHRHYDLDSPKPVAWDSNIAEPMREALSGKSGVIVGRDYRGVEVIAAHEPVADLGLGIVAKIDLAEVRRPFIRAGIITGIIALVLTMAGVGVFFRVTNPILLKLGKTVDNLQQALREVKVLRGIMPICSYCKKIRDDDGYWNQVEVYIKDRSDADFSHSICPACMEEHFPKQFESLQSRKEARHIEAGSAGADGHAAGEKRPHHHR